MEIDEMANKITDPAEREELFRLYVDLQEKLYEVEHLIRSKDGWQNAKAYWFANLRGSLNDEEYVSGGNSTFLSFLQDHGIADKEGNFIEPPEEVDEDEELDTDLNTDTEIDNKIPTKD
jgi:hypothetical protein